MTEMTTTPAAQRLLALGNYVYLLLMFLAIAGVLSAAMFMQYARGELPCPLCLLQRAALLGVCFGIMLPARSGIHWHCHLRPPHAGLVGRHRALSLDRVRREVGCHRRQRAPAPI